MRACKAREVGLCHPGIADRGCQLMISKVCKFSKPDRDNPLMFLYRTRDMFTCIE